MEKIYLAHQSSRRFINQHPSVLALGFFDGVILPINVDSLLCTFLSGIYQRTSFFTYILAVLLTIAILPISIQSLDKLVPALT
ncbi:hypothetical protein J2S00_003875 [Caldalkalibacillus uzonensis]|uniref:Uncharacterized protein n=1 Tax=Caldalkalibacillus uzonensis TaxID=353224 RepID=A0ABU0CY01_9BACI|nr:hypothetical protein [Caldalkalibacillus uzonensis]